MTQLVCAVVSLLLFFTVSQVLHRRERKRWMAIALDAAEKGVAKGYGMGMDAVMDDVEHALGRDLAEQVARHGLERLNRKEAAN